MEARRPWSPKNKLGHTGQCVSALNVGGIGTAHEKNRGPLTARRNHDKPGRGNLSPPEVNQFMTTTSLSIGSFVVLMEAGVANCIKGSREMKKHKWTGVVGPQDADWASIDLQKGSHYGVTLSEV
ncbi:hypothetical protein NDU88_006266 [Pleurodeles waltl]|uniref:Uncharacterized protein n=1 Tax=Pleurodeles waltl TaxID=8319 RepID=A0AAV7UMA0_PLEWA|nr:hypothetical protein NDU88_006266 [Pleurodeles waltl]